MSEEKIRFRWLYHAEGGRIGFANAAALPENRRLEANRDLPMLRDMSAWFLSHQDFSSMMSSLEEYGVMPPPHWNYVSGLLARAGTPGAGPDDEQVIGKYATTLRERKSAIEETMKWAAIACVGVRGSREKVPLEDGFRALEKRAAFDSESVDRFPVIKAALKGMPSIEPITPWLDEIVLRHNAIQSLQISKDEWTAMEAEDWELWVGRLRKYIEENAATFPTHAIDVLLRGAGRNPASLFLNDLSTMSINRWSRALIAAMDRSNSILTDACCKGLVLEKLSTKVHAKIPIVPTGLIVSTREGKAGTLLPSNRFGCFNLEPPAHEIVERLRSRLMTFDWVLIETPANVNALSAEVRVRPQERLEQLRPLWHPQTQFAFFGPTSLPTEVTPTAPYVTNPQTLDDLFEHVQRGTS